jgi:asparagine synthase (glutamine-hydrolysing)
MCGICGIVPDQPRTPAELRRAVRRMGAWQLHRGPDAWGEHVTDRVALGHNRLAILDIACGQQPMTSADGQVHVVFNGEIYNFRQLWRELETRGHCFRTDHSDTEVILNGYLEWGDVVFARLDGMFAIAIWDERKRQLHLACDRIGIKPLCFAHLADGGLAFASEPKALIGSRLVEPTLRSEGLAEYFLYRAPRGPHTLWNNIQRITPGTSQVYVPATGLQPPRAFWHLTAEPQHTLSFADAQRELASRLDAAVESHLISDVPVGIFLSGGVDSSLIASLMAQHSKLQAFTIGSESELDESRHAQAVARHLGLPFHCRLVRGEEYIANFNDWTYINDNLTADPSSLALMLLAETARDHGMKVMLAGEGGDELLGGYNSYLRYAVFHELSKLPAAGLIGRMLPFSSEPRSRDYLRLLQQHDLRFLGTGHLTDLQTRLDLLDPSLHDFIRAMENERLSLPPAPPLRRAMLADELIRLPDDLLPRTDRATMFYALEARVPLLANDIIDWANRLPDKYCIRLLGKETKPLLKGLSAARVPSAAIYRPKRGFDLPLRDWLYTDFRDMRQELLRDQRIPVLNYNTVRRLSDMLATNTTALLSNQIWAWIVLENWHRLWMLSTARPRFPVFIKKLPAYQSLRDELETF